MDEIYLDIPDFYNLFNFGFLLKTLIIIIFNQINIYTKSFWFISQLKKSYDQNSLCD